MPGCRTLRYLVRRKEANAPLLRSHDLRQLFLQCPKRVALRHRQENRAFASLDPKVGRHDSASLNTCRSGVSKQVTPSLTKRARRNGLSDLGAFDEAHQPIARWCRLPLLSVVRATTCTTSAQFRFIVKVVAAVPTIAASVLTACIVLGADGGYDVLSVRATCAAGPRQRTLIPALFLLVLSHAHSNKHLPHTLTLDHVAPATRLLEKRRQMFEVRARALQRQQLA